jgi:hypothetical protein
LTGADRDLLFGALTNLTNKGYLYRPLSYNGQITIFVPKFVEYFKFTNANAGMEQPYDALVLLVTMSLNRIEAHIMTKQFTLAIEEMDYFLSVRITGYNVATDKIGSKILAKYPVIDNEYTPFTLTAIQTSYISNCGDEKKRVYS